MAVHKKAVDMLSGSLALKGYCSWASMYAGLDLSAEDAYQAVSGSLKIAATMNIILMELTGKFDLWLFCEVDRIGLLPSLKRLDLNRYFPPNHQLFTPELGASGQVPDLIPALLSASKANLDELLWVDDRSMIASAAIRAGLNAVAYVNPFRFRRNLILRRMIKQ
ncbi:MAG: hypothetical protein PHQ40_18230 [Anaerolineaceae bacterium]|nr:hypothetical protein [Anaerolineaceae bacterium]